MPPHPGSFTLQSSEVLVVSLAQQIVSKAREVATGIRSMSRRSVRAEQGYTHLRPIACGTVTDEIPLCAALVAFNPHAVFAGAGDVSVRCDDLSVAARASVLVAFRSPGASAPAVMVVRASGDALESVPTLLANCDQHVL